MGRSTITQTLITLCTRRNQAMEVDRRSALSLGLVGAVAPLLASSSPARAQALGDWVPNYSPTDGEDIGGGRRFIDLGLQPSFIPAYSSIQVIEGRCCVTLGRSGSCRDSGPLSA